MLPLPEIRGFHFYVDDRKWLVRGVTYGPFRRDRETGDLFPSDARLETDMAEIAEMGANVVRVYTPPSERMAEAAARHGLRLLVDVPWPKHLDVYGDKKLRRMAFDALDDALEAALRVPNLMGILLGNEIPADLVRWAGPAKVERFLKSLCEHARKSTGNIPLGFANFPSTEYLSLGFFDFLGFNVYLSSREDMRSYFVRLRNLYPDMPLILTETGEDSMGQGEEQQCCVVSNSLTEAYDAGFAGGFVFSWTDEWHTGGYDINDWAFGIVDKKRRPKRLHGVVKRIFVDAPRTRIPSISPCTQSQSLREAIALSTSMGNLPRVSVVVCTYNGGSTLRRCLESLQHLNFPDYEVIVVDDGSTDNTREILNDFPGVRAIHQENMGLSCARNVGIEAARGEIVAFTDSDCVADEDWLHHLAVAFKGPLTAGVGGANMTPRERSALHRCVALAPGHATHILLDAERAEHVPGCNMAFRKTALVEMNGFDPVFHAAGDDVDLIWRLQEAGYEIRFAPGAFVWHHRRSTIRAYWRQQAGYGEAEAMLIRKHPHRFNDRGQSLWRGRIYSGRGEGSLFRRPDVHYGVFATSGYQCIYTRREGLATQFVVSPEWMFFCLFLIVMGLFSGAALMVGIMGLAATLLVTGMHAYRRFDASRTVPPIYLPVVWFLWLAQPVVRTGSRYLASLRIRHPDRRFRDLLDRVGRQESTSSTGSHVAQYWGEEGAERHEMLQHLCRRMREEEWPFWPNSGWEPWDLSIGINWSHRLIVTTAAEDHGAGRYLLKVKKALRATSVFWLLLAGVVLGAGLLALHDTILARLVILAFVLFAWWLHRRALARRRAVGYWISDAIEACGYIPLWEHQSPEAESNTDDIRLESVEEETEKEHVAP